MRAGTGMRAYRHIRKLVVGATLASLTAAVGVVGCSLFQNETVSRGHHLYSHYCMHCHGESGHQNEGYNWGMMPDPRPKDLSNKGEMSTFKDEEIFGTISRDMKDTTPEVGDKIGDDEFAVPTMPTFKYTLSEEEIWSIVAYVRTLHGMKLTYDLEARKKEVQEKQQSAQQAFDQTKQALEVADKKASDEAEKKGVEVDDAATVKEQEAFGAASKELEKAKVLATSFSTRPKAPSTPRPDLTIAPEQAAKLADVGKRLYTNKYGCNACHRVGEDRQIRIKPVSSDDSHRRRGCRQPPAQPAGLPLGVQPDSAVLLGPHRSRSDQDDVGQVTQYCEQFGVRRIAQPG